MTKEEIKNLIKKEIYEREYFEFFKKAVTLLEPSTPFHFSWYHKYLCDVAQREIERIAQGLPRERHYVINQPPRTTKSLIFAICLNAWAWIKYPHLKFGSVSYSDNLAISHAYKTKLIITSEWYVNNWGDSFKLRSDDNQKGSYSNDKGGHRMGMGLGAGILGQGFDIILADDVNKTSEISKVALDNVTDTFKDTIYTRLNVANVGSIVIIQQRTAENDLSGYVMKNYPDEFDRVTLPMELCETIYPPELAQNYVEGLLHPERFNHHSVMVYKKILGSRNYSGQYKMMPVDDEASLIKNNWFEIINYNIEELKNVDWHFFLDTAMTEKQTNDPSGIIIVGKVHNDLIIKKAFKFYLGFPDLIKKIIELHTTYGNSRTKIYIEPKASGISIVQQLKRITKFNVIQMPAPKDSKETRLNAAAPQVEGGRVKLINDSWNKEFVEEITTFPAAAHDEYVDLLGYSIEELLNKNTQINYSFNK